MKAVFFDAGGTLVHIDYPRVAAVVERVLGRKLDVADFVAAEYEGRAAIEAGMAKGDLPTDTSRWSVHFRAMLRSLGLTDEEFDRVAPGVIEEHKRRHLWSAVVDGTADALRALKGAGWRVAVISNADGTVEKLLGEVGLTDALEFVIDSGKVGVEKPDARIFELALDRSGLAAAECYYVGDIYPIDVVGSREVGMVPVLMDPLRRYGERECRTIVSVPEFCRELVSATAAA